MTPIRRSTSACSDLRRQQRRRHLSSADDGANAPPSLLRPRSEPARDLKSGQYPGQVLLQRGPALQVLGQARCARSRCAVASAALPDAVRATENCRRSRWSLVRVTRPDSSSRPSTLPKDWLCTAIRRASCSWFNGPAGESLQGDHGGVRQAQRRQGLVLAALDHARGHGQKLIRPPLLGLRAGAHPRHPDRRPLPARFRFPCCSGNGVHNAHDASLAPVDKRGVRGYHVRTQALQ